MVAVTNPFVINLACFKEIDAVMNQIEQFKRIASDRSTMEAALFKRLTFVRGIVVELHTHADLPGITTFSIFATPE